MTEVLPYAMNPPYGEKRIGSVGKAGLGMTLRLIDESGRELPEGEPGEVLVQSDATMIGYWDDPENTAHAIRDGWLHTGDLAYKDAAGHYWFVGRSKDIIVRGGSNVSPLEVEAVLYQHPAVREVAVVGVPDPAWGEVVRAFVSLRPGQPATEH